MAATVKEIVAEAIVVLDRDGWCQGVTTNEKGQHCAIGALLTAFKARNQTQIEFSSEYSTYLEAIDAVQRETGDLMLSRWNDNRRRTQAEVRAAFVRALEEGES